MTIRNFVVKNGLTVGNAIIDAETSSITVASANLGNLATANFFGGNANALFNIQGANVVGTVANATHASTANTVVDAAQPNITSVGTLTGLTLSGVANLGANGNVIITGGTEGQFLQTNGSGNLSWVTVGTSGISNGTSNVDIPVSGGNVNTSVGGVANVFVVTTTGANVTGTFESSGNANVGNLGTAGLITATGNVSGGNLTTAGAVAATGNVTGGNLSTGGTLSVTGNANVGNIGAAAGVFSSTVSATGNVSGGNLTTAGAVAATGNVSGGNLTTAGAVDATGNVSGGNITTAGVVTATGNVSGGNLTTGGALSVTGNANVGNLGTGGLITATGNVSGGNLTTAGAVDATGNVSGGNLVTTGLVSATGNVNGGNVNASGKVVASTLESNVANGTAPLTVASTTLVTNLNADLLDGYNTDVAATANTVVVRDADGNIAGNNISGTLSTAAQPNITSVGTLSSLDVTGNITTSANLVTDLIVGKTTSVSIAAAGSDQNVFLKPSGTGVVDVWGAKISNVATPTASTDAATKGYVDAAIEGLSIHAPSLAATPDTLANISSGTVTYDNGTAGVGATLTTTGSYTTIDGVNIASAGTRILVKNEANAAHNGIYVYTSSTVLTRASDFDTPTEMAGGDFTFVQQGTLYNDTGWVMTDAVTTVGTTDVNWLQFSGAGTYSAGTGLTLNGTQFSISNTAVTAGSYGNGDAVATFTVNDQGQLTAASNVAIAANAANLTGSTLSSNITTSSLTSVGTLGSLSVTGNVSAGNVSATDVTGTTLGGTLTTAAQPNITSVGTLSSLSVTGNVDGGNLTTGGAVVATGNVSGGNLTTAGAVVATGNVSGGNLTTAGAVDATGNVSGGNITTGGLVSATGNVSGGNLTTAGALSVTGNANVGNIGAAAGVFTGNLSALNANLGNLVEANYVTIANDLIVTGNANIGSGSGGSISGANLISANFITGTLTTAAQPNITSVGSLTDLTVTGNASAGNLSTGGTLSVTGNASAGNLSTGGALSVTGNANVGNLGTAQVLASANVTAPQFISNVANGTAPLLVSSSTLVANLNADLLDGYNSDVANTANTIALRDANGNISANYFIGDGSSLTGISSISNGTSNVSVALDGNVTVGVAGNAAIATFTGVGSNIGGTLDVTGNLTAANVGGGNLVTANFLAGTLTTAAQPNITSVGTLSSLSVTGNVGAGNVYANSGTIGANLLAGTLTTAAQPNVTSVGTLTSLDVSGNATVGGNVKVQVGITSNRSNVSVTSSPTVIDEFAPGSWRTAKYVISGSGDDGFQSAEVILVHDGTDAYISIYGSVCSNVTADLYDLTANIDGVSGNVTVYANSNSANCLVNLVSSYIKT